MRTQEVGDIGEAVNFERCSYEHLESQGLRPHPDACAEAASLAAVSLPTVTYRMGIPPAVAISATQWFLHIIGHQRHIALQYAR